MKKYMILLIIVALMVSMMASCGIKKTSGVARDDIESSQNIQTSDGKNNVADKTDKIVNAEGKEFIADISVKGEIKENGTTINDNKLTLGGRVYTFPIKMSELFDNGWEFSDGYTYQKIIKANSSTNLVSYYLTHESGIKISLEQVINDSDEDKNIEDCLLVRFSIYKYNVEDDCDLVFPGGITQKSTAADVISVFGDPNKSEDFEGNNSDLSLTYKNNKKSGIKYDFIFNEDGSLYVIRIDYEIQ